VPIGHCVIIKDGRVVYNGPLSRSTVSEGVTVWLNPKDFDRIDAKMRKFRH